MSDESPTPLQYAAVGGGLAYGVFASWFADYILGARESEAEAPGTVWAILALGLILVLLACIVRAFLLRSGSETFKVSVFAMIGGYGLFAALAFFGLFGS